MFYEIIEDFFCCSPVICVSLSKGKVGRNGENCCLRLFVVLIETRVVLVVVRLLWRNAWCGAWWNCSLCVLCTTGKFLGPNVRSIYVVRSVRSTFFHAGEFFLTSPFPSTPGTTVGLPFSGLESCRLIMRRNSKSPRNNLIGRKTTNWNVHKNPEPILFCCSDRKSTFYNSS